MLRAALDTSLPRHAIGVPRRSVLTFQQLKSDWPSNLIRTSICRGEFDVVLNAFGLPHVPNPDIATAEAYRVLKPAGRARSSGS